MERKNAASSLYSRYSDERDPLLRRDIVYYSPPPDFKYSQQFIYIRKMYFARFPSFLATGYAIYYNR